MGEYQMSEKEQAMADAIGKHVVEKLLSAAESPEAVDRIMGTWATKLQQAIGRAVLRVIIYLAVGSLSFVAMSDKAVHAVKELFK